jgi:hypothetical protein
VCATGDLDVTKWITYPINSSPKQVCEHLQVPKADLLVDRRLKSLIQQALDLFEWLLDGIAGFEVLSSGRPCASAEGENRFVADALSWLVGRPVSKNSFRYFSNSYHIDGF